MNAPLRFRAVLILALGLPGLSRAAGDTPGIDVPPAATPAPRIGRLAEEAPVPEFAANAPDGTEVKLSSFKGKTVVLAFFTAAKGTHPELVNVAKRYADQPVTVWGVCSASTKEEFTAWYAKAKDTLNFPVAWDPAGTTKADNAYAKVFGLSSSTATGVIDREGKVVGGYLGYGSRSSAVLALYLKTAGVKLVGDDVSLAASEAGERAPRGAAAAQQDEPKPLADGEVAPDFTTKALDGAEVKLSDFKGKIVVLDFWATWCGPCLMSLPHTQGMARKYKDQDVVVLAACTSDTKANFAKWMKFSGEDYPNIVFSHDPAEDGPERASAKLYHVNGIPARFIIGRDGKVVRMVGGYGPGDVRVEAVLSKLGVKIDPEIVAEGEKQLTEN